MQLDAVVDTLEDMRSDMLWTGLFVGDRDEDLLLIAGHINAAIVLTKELMKKKAERGVEHDKAV